MPSTVYLCLVTVFLVSQCFADKRRPLSPQENEDLQKYCGRFVPGYNSVSESTGFKSLYGTPMQSGRVPWTVSIVNRNGDGTYSQRASGTLISSRHILTAAHVIGVTKADCQKKIPLVYEMRPQDMAVFLNVTCATPEICRAANRREFFLPLKLSSLYAVKEYISEYCPGYLFYHDLAVFELEVDIPFSSAVYPACLATTSPAIGDSMTLYGYGDDVSDKSLPQTGILKSIKSNVVDCSSNNYVVNNSICTTSDTYGRSCPGDSGAGLIRHRKGRPTAEVVGVLTGGYDCKDIFDTQNGERKNNQTITTWPDVLASVPENIGFFCRCCGICFNQNNTRGKRSTEISTDFVQITDS